MECTDHDELVGGQTIEERNPHNDIPDQEVLWWIRQVKTSKVSTRFSPEIDECHHTFDRQEHDLRKRIMSRLLRAGIIERKKFAELYPSKRDEFAAEKDVQEVLDYGYRILNRDPLTGVEPTEDGA